MIAKKILSIMSEIKAIEKTELDEEKNFKYIKSDEVISMVKPLLEKYKVIILPSKILGIIPQGNKVYISMKYQFIDAESEEGDMVEVEIPGGGFDEKGRAIYAALTGAYRYAMQEVFAIPLVDEIKNEDSNEESSEEKDSEKQEENLDNDFENISELIPEGIDLDELFNNKVA